MTDLAATVLIPTHEHSELLPYAARSALRQSVAGLELFIVGDGVEDDTREVVARLEAEDERVRFFDMPKGDRLGEAYRDQILTEARGGVVCYLSDDDLWLPDHVEAMLAALAKADFASATTLCYRSEDELDVLVHDLTMPFYRQLLLSGHSRVPLSAGAHTMEMYRRLPYGWRTTPPATPTDLYMWQQFLTEPSCRLVTAMRPTVVNFPSSERRDWSPDRREAELKAWSDRLADGEGRRDFAAELPGVIARAQAREWARLFSEWQSLMEERAHRQADAERLRTKLESERGFRRELEGELRRLSSTRRRQAFSRARRLGRHLRRVRA